MTRRPIAILPEVLIDQIAAGEVVERPVSAVKELVDNALDAGAGRVEVEIEGGGLTRVSVRDDGWGMTPEEMRLSVARHATSKIASVDDLHAVSTLGFRGEALPSIASVSRLEIVSRPEGVDSAWRIVVEGGVEKAFEPASGQVGTAVSVSGLFFNTPARRKFLAGAPTEARATAALLTGVGLANPDVALAFTVDGRQTISWPAVDSLRERAAQVFGRHRAGAMVPLSFESPDLRVVGLLGRPADSIRTRRDQHFIVNRRPVENRDLRNVLFVAYGELVPRGMFPAAVIDVALDPSAVDPNVHPRKTEVRFADARRVHDVLHAAVRRALSGGSAVPDLPIAQRRGEEPTFGDEDRARVERAVQDYVASAARDQPWLSFPRERGAAPPSRRPIPDEAAADSTERQLEPKPWRPPVGASDEPQVVSRLWQFQDSYVFAQVRGALIILDQHAAHERVLYEEALSHLTGAASAAQELLFPIVLDATPEERLALAERSKALERLGFRAQQMEERAVVVSAVPAALSESSGARVLRDMLADLRAAPNDVDAVRRIAASYACHAAVRAGQQLSTEEMSALVDRLFACREPTACPHGRPTMVRVTMSEIERRFMRE